MFDPSGLMPVLWVPVRPVDYAAFVIPLILATEGNRITSADGRNPRRQVDVMCNEECTSAAESYDKTLVPAPIVIVGQHTNDLTATLYLLPTTPIVIERNRVIAASEVSGPVTVGLEMIPADNGDRDKYDREEFLHAMLASLRLLLTRIDRSRIPINDRRQRIDSGRQIRFQPDALFRRQG